MKNPRQVFDIFHTLISNFVNSFPPSRLSLPSYFLHGIGNYIHARRLQHWWDEMEVKESRIHGHSVDNGEIAEVDELFRNTLFLNVVYYLIQYSLF